MKGLVLLFSFYILTLSIVPCCESDACINESGQTKSPSKQESPCSPFVSCSACSGFVIAEKCNLPIVTRIVVLKHSTILINDELAKFPPATWRPPRFS